MVTDPWLFESAVEYHVVSAPLHSASSPINFTKKRPLSSDACTRDGRPCSIHGYPNDDRPLWQGRSPITPLYGLSPVSRLSSGRDGAVSRATHLSTGSVSDLTLKRAKSARSPHATPGGGARQAAKPATSRQHAAVSGPERGLYNRWAHGTLSITLYGEGGQEGGELRVFNSTTGLVVFTARLPSLDEDGAWDLTDVQQLHQSVTERRHALSLQLRGNSVNDGRAHSVCMPHGLGTHFHDGSTPSVKSLLGAPPFLVRHHKDNDGRFLGGIFPRLSRRSRSKHDLNSADDGRQSDRPELFQVCATGDHELFLYIGFTTLRDRDDWFGILRGMARVPVENGRHARRHRRLKLSILEVHEHAPKPPPQPLPETKPARPPDSSYVDLRPDAKAARPRNPKQLKAETSPGWATKEPMRIELLLDNRLVARTGWTSGTDIPFPPQWGQTWDFVELPQFSTCTMLFLRTSPKKEKVAIVFAKVEVPISSTFLGVEDRRYPIHSFSGAVIGEIRLSVSYQELDIVPLAQYEAFQLQRSPLTAKFLYVMSGKGVMDGSSEYLCRVGLCEGVLIERVRDTVSFEARSSGSTLFRSTTPLSKTLDTLMRMMCQPYLETSLGRTVRRVINERIELRPPVGDAESVDRIVVKDVIEGCWADLYVNRHIFPTFIRHVFGHLFNEVKDFHGGGVGKDALHYKAVSSFVFLRLIGPALMSPHLFGLTECLVPPPQQRTLTLVAKVLHTLAFFSEKDMFRHSDVSLFKDVIEDNGAAMVDYLVFLASPSSAWTEIKSVSPVVDKMLLERRRVLHPFVAESVPFLTEAGPIDLSVNWAMCCEIWYEKRRQPGYALKVDESLSSAVTPELASMIVRYDKFINHIHGLAFPECATPTVASTPSRATPSDRKGAHRHATVDNKATGAAVSPGGEHSPRHSQPPISPLQTPSASPRKPTPSNPSPSKATPAASPIREAVVEIGAADPSEVVIPPRRYVRPGGYGGDDENPGREGESCESSPVVEAPPQQLPGHKPTLSIDTRVAQLTYRPPQSKSQPGTHRPRASVTDDAKERPTSLAQSSTSSAATPLTAPLHTGSTASGMVTPRTAQVLPDGGPLARRASHGSQSKSHERKRRPTMPHFPLKLLGSARGTEPPHHSLEAS